jgi:hypothetical protein
VFPRDAAAQESEETMTWLCITYLRAELLIVLCLLYAEHVRHSDFPTAIVRR